MEFSVPVFAEFYEILCIDIFHCGKHSEFGCGKIAFDAVEELGKYFVGGVADSQCCHFVADVGEVCPFFAVAGCYG